MVHDGTYSTLVPSPNTNTNTNTAANTNGNNAYKMRDFDMFSVMLSVEDSDLGSVLDLAYELDKETVLKQYRIVCGMVAKGMVAKAQISPLMIAKARTINKKYEMIKRNE